MDRRRQARSESPWLLRPREVALGSAASSMHQSRAWPRVALPAAATVATGTPEHGLRCSSLGWQKPDFRTGNEQPRTGRAPPKIPHGGRFRWQGYSGPTALTEILFEVVPQRPWNSQASEWLRDFVRDGVASLPSSPFGHKARQRSRELANWPAEHRILPLLTKPRRCNVWRGPGRAAPLPLGRLPPRP